VKKSIPAAVVAAILAGSGLFSGNSEAQTVNLSVNAADLVGASIYAHGEKVCFVRHVRLNREGQIAEYIAECGASKSPDRHMVLGFEPRDIQVLLGPNKKPQLFTTALSPERVQDLLHNY
jgi:hypothetical protein